MMSEKPSHRAAQKSDRSSSSHKSDQSDNASQQSDKSSHKSDQSVRSVHKSDRGWHKASHVSFEDEVEAVTWSRSLDKVMLRSSDQRINCSLYRRRQADEASLLSAASKTLPKFSNGK